MTDFYHFSDAMRDVSSWFNDFASDEQDDIVDSLNLYWTTENALLYEWLHTPLIHSTCLPAGWKEKTPKDHAAPIASANALCFGRLNAREAEMFYWECVERVM